MGKNKQIITSMYYLNKLNKMRCVMRAACVEQQASGDAMFIEPMSWMQRHELATQQVRVANCETEIETDTH